MQSGTNKLKSTVRPVIDDTANPAFVASNVLTLVTTSQSCAGQSVLSLFTQIHSPPHDAPLSPPPHPFFFFFKKKKILRTAEVLFGLVCTMRSKSPRDPESLSGKEWKKRSMPVWRGGWQEVHLVW